MKNCLICEKHSISNDVNKVFKNEILTVSHGPLESHILGYMYIEPNRHIENWDELTDKEMLEIVRTIQKLSGILKKEVNAERVYTVTISEVVRHLHIHVIPRSEEVVVRGVSLIEQATQSKLNTNHKITQKDIEKFIAKAKTYF